MSSQRSYSFSRQVLVNGIRDGIPIGLGYFAVSFSLGIAARKAGLSPFQGFLASLFNNASAGEYAAFTLIAANAGYLQVAIITLIANARYLLMSCALAQRFSPDTPFFHRFLIGYDVTDELFGITIARPGWLNPYYTYGAILVAAPAWSIGTALGIIAGNLLPLRAVTKVKGTQTPLGEGETQFREIVRMLKEFGYEGDITIEREIDDPVVRRRDLAQAKCLLNEWMKEA